MQKYQKTGLTTLEDGVQIENPIWGWSDTDQMYMNGDKIQLRVEYFTGLNQTVATHSRWYEFNLVDIMTIAAQNNGDLMLAGRTALLGLPQHTDSTEI